MRSGIIKKEKGRIKKEKVLGGQMAYFFLLPFNFFLEPFGAPARNRTGISGLEGSGSIHLSYRSNPPEHKHIQCH
jgi:hypothetical protein